MAIRLWRATSLAALSLLAIGASAACGPISLPLVQSGADSDTAAGLGQPASIAGQDTANATATPVKVRTGGVRFVPVTRNSLTETLALDGTATAPAQEPINYAWRAIVDDVKVKAGQPVKQDDILVEFSQGEIPAKLAAARAKLQVDTASLALAQTQAQTSQDEIAQRVAAEQKKQQQAVLDAQLAVTRAQENLAKVQAGKSATEKQAADAAVTEYLATNMASAQNAVDLAMAGPDDNTIRAAQRDVANAQLTLSRAQADLDALTRGPDALAVRTATTAVLRAQSVLQLAQAAKIDPKAPDSTVAKMQNDNAIQEAQAGLDNAQAQLAKLKQPPAEVDVQAAQLKVIDAQTTVQNAQDRLDALQAGPDQAAIDAAQRQMQAAKRGLAQLTGARDEVYSHPTKAELNQAQDQVRAAQVVLDNAREVTPAMAAAGLDLGPLQQVISQDQADVAAAEASLENTHLRAPFDGTVVSVRARPGEMPVPSKPVVILARPGPPIVRVDLDDTQAGRINVGQTASIQIGTGASATTVPAQLASVTPAAQDGSVDASAVLNVAWADSQVPKLGTPVQVAVNLGSKQDVLVVPKSAVHQSGGRNTVEVQDGTIRRLVSVQVGITTGAGVEIVSGLSEGQMVMAGPA
ncbi:MAG: HlyD family efflux transporter periplasmic adaptor subunit [Chloroflexota bacterium]